MAARLAGGVSESYDLGDGTGTGIGTRDGTGGRSTDGEEDSAYWHGEGRGDWSAATPPSAALRRPSRMTGTGTGSPDAMAEGGLLHGQGHRHAGFTLVHAQAAGTGNVTGASMHVSPGSGSPGDSAGVAHPREWRPPARNVFQATHAAVYTVKHPPRQIYKRRASPRPVLKASNGPASTAGKAGGFSAVPNSKTAGGPFGT